MYKAINRELLFFLIRNLDSMMVHLISILWLSPTHCFTI